MSHHQNNEYRDQRNGTRDDTPHPDTRHVADQHGRSAEPSHAGPVIPVQRDTAHPYDPPAPVPVTTTVPATVSAPAAAGRVRRPRRARAFTTALTTAFTAFAGFAVVVAGAVARWWSWWVTYWPGLRYVPAAGRAAGRTLARVGRGCAHSGRRCARVGRGCARVVRTVARGVADRVGPVARLTARWVTRWWGARMAPPLRDAAGWVVHTAPGLAVRLIGRGLRCLPGVVWWIVRHATVGTGWLLVRLVRFCLAYPEYAGLVREARDLDRPKRVKAYTESWRRAALARTVGTVIVTGALAGAGVWLDTTHGRPALVAALTVFVMVLAGIGRAVRPAPPVEPGTDPAEPGPDDPFPIADAHTRAEAADCVRRALAAEGIELRGADAARTRWGWEVAVVLRRGTPAQIVAKAGDLETHCDLAAGALLITPDRTRRARVVLRLAVTDPFAGLTAPSAPRDPGRATITDRVVIGQHIDGSPARVPLLGVHGVVIGASGSGKSTTLRVLATAVADCADALVWDLDPAGCGLDALADAVGRRERDPAGITDALADALALAHARPRMLGPLGMGSAWNPTPERPALVVFVDEYPRLPDKAKEHAVALLRIGRKARVTLILAATEATSDALGAAVADSTALRVLHPCRHADVRLVLGPQMLADGWRPDRLHPATADDPGDAGRAYLYGAGSREPLITAVHPLPDTDTTDRATRRAALGIPRIDTDSWTLARAWRANTDPHTPPGAAKPTATSGVLLDVLTVFGDDRRLWTGEILDRLTTHHDRYRDWTPDQLATALRPHGVTPVQIRRDNHNRNGYDRDHLTTALGTT